MNTTLELEGAAVAKVLEPVMRGLPPGVARVIAELRADPELQARIDELADRCNAGLLTEEERAEYTGYVEAIDLVAILQAEARAATDAAV